MNALMAKQRLCYILAADRALTNAPKSRLAACYEGRNSVIFDSFISVLPGEWVELKYDPSTDQGRITIFVEYTACCSK